LLVLHLITIRLYAEGVTTYTPASVGVFIFCLFHLLWCFSFVIGTYDFTSISISTIREKLILKSSMRSRTHEFHSEQGFKG